MSFVGYLKDRFGYNSYIKTFLDKPVGADVNWFFTFGSLCLFLFFVQAATGIVLAFYYVPSPDHAYQSVDYVIKEVPFGRLVHGIHHWTASFMIVAVFAHMLRVYFYGAYKSPREMTWVTGVLLFVVTLAFGFTGYLLPWDQKAYWATVVGTSVPKGIPVIGDFIVRLLRGGDEVSALTLSRFYSIHMLVLPTFILALIAVHIYLIRIHDIAGHWNENDPRKKVKHSFFPDHFLKDITVALVVFAVILLVAIFVEPKREEIAGTFDPNYIPRPEWYFMWLFKLLTYFSGKAETIANLAIPIGGAILLLLLPFLSKTPLRSPADRPLATAIGVMCIVGLVYASAMGIADSKPYGQVIVVPDRKLTPVEWLGIKSWVEKDCAYCHSVKGRGGRREGPDLSNVIARDRTKDWLKKFIKDPKSVSRWNIMPKYDLTDQELEALAQYVLSLDFKHYRVKTIPRQEILERWPALRRPAGAMK